MERIILALLLLLPYSVLAQALTFKNDFFAPGGSDRWLTNDVRISYHDWAIGSEMYTPTDKRSAAIPEGDRPWDGYTYAERRFDISHWDTKPLALERRFLTLRVGAIGEASKAKRLQKWMHNDLGFGSDPQGWDTANPSELAVDGEYEHEIRGRLTSWVGIIDSVQSYGVRAGNVRVSTWLDQEIQRGFDYDDWTFRTIAGIRGEGVAYNTFLDGRMFHDDVYTVERQPFVATARAGIEVHRKSWFLRYIYSYMTEEFEGQDGRHLFGTIEVGVNQ